MSFTPEIVPAALFSLRANILVNLAVENGASVDDVLMGTGIESSRMRQQPVHITWEQYVRIVTRCVERFPAPGMGLEFGRRLNVTARGTLGLAVLSMNTLAEVIRFGVKYQDVFEPSQRVSLETREDGVHLVCRQDESMPPALARFLAESHFASLLHTSRYLLHAHFDPVLVTFACPEPHDLHPFHHVLGRRVRFGADEYRLVLPHDILEARLPSANPVVARACYDACDDLLRNWRRQQTLTYRINDLLMAHNGEYPSLKALAQWLSLDERTVRRRLALENTSYKTLLNEARKRHASRLLSVRSNSVESVAMALGFNNASNFRRAFKAWTGLNPGEFREQPEAMHRRTGS